MLRKSQLYLGSFLFFVFGSANANPDLNLQKEIIVTPQEVAVIQVAMDDFRKTKVSLKDYLVKLQRGKVQGDYVVTFQNKEVREKTKNSTVYGSPSKSPTFEVIIKTTPTAIDLVKSYFVR